MANHSRGVDFRVARWHISLLVLMVARYMLFRFKTHNSRYFKCVLHPFELVYYITAITTDNVKGFG